MRKAGPTIRLMTTDLKRQVGHRVAALREARGFTQEHLAELIGRSAEAISKIERGKAFPSPETFEGLSHTLNVPVRDFFPASDIIGDSRSRLEARANSLLAGLNDDTLEVCLDVLKALSRLPFR